jgi:hypothetical protein
MRQHVQISDPLSALCLNQGILKEFVHRRTTDIEELFEDFHIWHHISERCFSGQKQKTD